MDHSDLLTLNTTDIEQHETLRELVNAATADNTRRAYQSDLRQFLSWGGQLPTTSQQIMDYLQVVATTLNPNTLQRRVLALHHWHELQGIDDPTKNQLVKKTLTGIRRKYGRPVEKPAPFLLSDIDRSAAYWQQQDTLVSLRDRALVLIGFHVAGRRNELSAMDWEHIDYAEEGMVIHFPRSKTDQYHKGTNCSIPVGSAPHRCPLQALLDWRKESGCHTGPVFRALSKTERVLERSISPYQVNCRVQWVARAANLPNASKISAHSLRRGFATEAARRGVPLKAIMQHGRWKSIKTVLEYIEEGRGFIDSPLKAFY